MPTIPVGYLESTFIFTCAGISRQATWALGFDDVNFVGDSPASMAATIATAFAAAGRPYAASNIQTGWTWQGVSVVKMLETGPSIGTNLSPIVGTQATTPVPINCALLLNKVTASGGRRNRGRAFVPPLHMTEGVVDAGGFIPAGTVSTMNTPYAAAMTALATAGYSPVLFHGSAPFTPTPITSLVFQTQLATQRRRMRS